MQKHEPKVTIIIIHYNTPHFLKTCFDHILKQTYKNIEVLFIDNNSKEKAGVNFAKTQAKTQSKDHPQIQVIENKENLGYAKAANQGIRLALKDKDTKYIVITNPDIIYSPTYFEKIIYRAKAESKANANAKTNAKPLAGITGKIYKYDFGAKKSTKIIDTVGLYISKTFRITDGAQGTLDQGQFDQEKEVFGISGACPLYSRAAIEQSAITINNKTEYFDEDFFMYKEDVDLSWRLQRLGFRFLYYPKAVAFHGRGTGVIQRETLRQILKSRKHLSKFQRYYSYRNHNFTLLKNLTWSMYLRNFPRVIVSEILKTIYVIFREPFVLKSLIDYIKLFPKMLKKRRIINLMSQSPQQHPKP
jgi:GT2 family glycosyltransferase